jgi:hypothetical protein
MWLAFFFVWRFRQPAIDGHEIAANRRVQGDATTFRRMTPTGAGAWNPEQLATSTYAVISRAVSV